MEKLQKTMKERKPILDMSKEEFDYSQKPIGKAIYKHSSGRPKVDRSEKAKPTDRITCKECGKEYFRSGSACHKRTVFHTERARVNKKLAKLLIED